MAENDKKARRTKKADAADKADQKDTKSTPERPQRPEGYLPRLYKRYTEEVSPAMMKAYGMKNRMQLPKIKKITVNVGCGEGSRDIKVLEAAIKDITLITGQKPVITRAKKSIANFKLREGMPIGCMVTLRGTLMYEFLDRLINLAIPRIKDFRGLSPKSFDGAGNYTFGLKDQVIFPEIEVDDNLRPTGMNITITIAGGSNELSRELLKGLGFPFSA